MTVEELIENSVLADFRLDGLLAGQVLRSHDYAKAKAGDDAAQDEAKTVVTVTAIDQGEFYPMSGIRSVRVEVEFRMNIADGNNDFAMLDRLAEVANDRLQTGREDGFTNLKVKTLGIDSSEGIARADNQLERIRMIGRRFVAVQLAS